MLTILKYPDPRLRKIAEAVSHVTPEIQVTIESLLETMYAADGVGLSATQVNIHQRIIVVDVSEHGDSPLVLINPELIEELDVASMREGCLSVPGFFEDIDRSQRIRVRALDRNGEAFEISAEGKLAVCIQHEMEHLEGKLFVDYLSELKRSRIRVKLEKDRRRAV